MSERTPLESLVGRDRVWVLTGIVGVTAVAWIWLARMASGMGGAVPPGADVMTAMGQAMTATRETAWTGIDFLLMFVMWAIMMIGMMLPSAAPMILLFAMVNRRKQARGRSVTPPAVFATGYLAAWTLFSLGATTLQWLLHRGGLLSPMLATTSAWLGGAVLLGAGLYQWSPLKATCLRHCQSPLQFLSTHWRDGTVGALRMGWRHGLYCLGCCWALMTLLFVGGVMNLLWIAGLALFVLVEKLWPRPWLPAFGGSALVAWGTLVIARGA